MEYLSGHVLTLANSIIGVSILAMPYCFKQCGIILSILILLISSIISRLACHFLLKSAILARRKTFEFLAFHIFGSLGKFSIEIGMIGFLLGTCIAFFVVMGDLAPDIVSEITGAKTGYTLRNGILVALAVFCVLPLGLLKNVDSLNGVSKATIGFYCALVLKTVVEALPHIFTGDWVREVVLWRPGGILQCLPIFSMALFCQSQIFEIYQAVPNASLEKMNNLIRVAVNMCTGVYIFVGTFGYIAFFQQPFTGNVLLSFQPSIMSDIMKIGFILSLAFSFPIVIFPCRASLYSLLYKEPHYTILHEGITNNYIPEVKFKVLTLFIVIVSLIIGIAIPNIELVLGLVGSTIGVIISVLFPVTCFICISPKNTNERILAQIMLCIGIIVMVLGTYANLYAYEVAKFHISTEKPTQKPLPLIQQEKIANIVDDIMLNSKKDFYKIDSNVLITVPVEKPIRKLDDTKIIEHQEAKANPEILDEIRHGQPESEEENEANKKSTKSSVLLEKIAEDEIKAPIEYNGTFKNHINQILEKEVREPNLKQEHLVSEESAKEIPLEPVIKPDKQQVEIKTDPPIDNENIKKQLAEAKAKEEENKKLIDSLKKQNEIQKELVGINKMLIKVIQNQQEEKVNEEKLKAVKHIETIALKAIESLSGGGEKNVEKSTEKHEKISEDNVVKAPVNAIEKSPEITLEKTSQKLAVERSEQTMKKLEKSIVDLKPESPREQNTSITLDEKPVKAIDKSFVDVSKQANIIETKPKIEKPQSEPSKVMNMVPLPIALANLSNSKPESKKDDAKEEDKKTESDVKVLRREILSQNDLERAKRETNEKIDLNDYKTAMKEVCDEMNNPLRTEKSILALCKLSKQQLELSMNNGVEIKTPQRDLK